MAWKYGASMLMAKTLVRKCVDRYTITIITTTIAITIIIIAVFVALHTYMTFKTEGRLLKMWMSCGKLLGSMR